MLQLDAAPPQSHQTKQELVYHTLRQAILRCTLRPGQRLVIADIAQQLQVSQIPVREALQMLQSEHLVATVPHSGATVAGISEDALEEVFTLLEGLETATTRIAAARLTAPRERQLAELIAQLDVALAERDYERWFTLNGTFHRTIARFTGMPTLREMTERALDHWERVHCFLFTGSDILRQLDPAILTPAQEEHRALLAAMRARDETRLGELVERHRRSALAAHQRRLQQLAPQASGGRAGRLKPGG